MKKLLHPLIIGSLLAVFHPWAWAEETPAAPIETGAMVIMLPQTVEEPAGRVQPRLRDSLQSLDHAGAEQAHAHPYRLSVDERKRMREQLRGQAPAYRISSQ